MDCRAGLPKARAFHQKPGLLSMLCFVDYGSRGYGHPRDCTCTPRHATFICDTQKCPWKKLKDVVNTIQCLNLLDYLAIHCYDDLKPNLLMMVDRMRVPSSSPAYPPIYDILTLTRETRA